VWFQITGTRCNLACRHCFNASGPRDPWLPPLGVDVVRRHLAEAEALGVREVYLTGGEPLPCETVTGDVPLHYQADA
jgi:MoaA/NifB/PqqE/SkfB family radical SAM enzyme